MLARREKMSFASIVLALANTVFNQKAINQNQKAKIKMKSVELLKEYPHPPQ